LPGRLDQESAHILAAGLLDRPVVPGFWAEDCWLGTSPKWGPTEDPKKRVLSPISTAFRTRSSRRRTLTIDHWSGLGNRHALVDAIAL
jgi:hypothetical protein